MRGVPESEALPDLIPAVEVYDADMNLCGGMVIESWDLGDRMLLHDIPEQGVYWRAVLYVPSETEEDDADDAGDQVPDVQG